jgi:tRNA-binding protein
VGTLRTAAQVTNYARDELLGRLVVGVLNIGERRVAGFVSQFLVLGAIQPDGTVHLLEVSEGVPPGRPIA